ncbi:MAG: hypothetical protein JXL84_17485 [Deltaproteobacteria bacterium]|nr:hypothetical protein [Deltaproteobacteria bacterium]
MKRQTTIKAALLLGVTWLCLHLGADAGRAFTFVTYADPSYVSMARVQLGIESTLDYNNAPFADAYAASGGSWGRSRRGSGYAISNGYQVDQDGTRYSRVLFSQDGLTQGYLAGSPGFLYAQASSLADYTLMLIGGQGAAQVNLAVSTGSNYLIDQIHSIKIYDGIVDGDGNLLPEALWRDIFSWDDGNTPSGVLSLAFNSPFLVRTESGVNVARTSLGSVDYQSTLNFTIDVAETLVPVPLPSTLVLMFFAMGAGLWGRNWAIRTR